jgi:hypothetical protein
MGNTFVYLFPDQNQDNKYYLRIKEIPACVSCALYAASPFFKEARKLHKDIYREDFLLDRRRLVLQRQISPHLVIYTHPLSLLPLRNAYRKGAAFFVFDPIASFWQIEVSLPSSQKEFIDFLLDQFIRMHSESASQYPILPRYAIPGIKVVGVAGVGSTPHALSKLKNLCQNPFG